jgi:hypothetical protein
MEEQIKLHIERSEDTPEVSFDASSGMYSILGRSLPENAYNFYHPVIDFVKSNIIKTGIKNTFIIQLDYFNSSSGRFIFELLTVLEEYQLSENTLQVIWKVEKDDELMIEKGEELQSMLKIPFQIEKT